MSFVCQLPPEGWSCSRSPGHPGPCAARPTSVELRFPEGDKTDRSEQGISTIKVAANVVTVTGWFDDVASWSASVILDDYQKLLLRSILGD